LQEHNENLKNISNNKISSTQEEISEVPRIILSYKQDDSISFEENGNSSRKEAQNKIKSDAEDNFNKIEEKLNTIEHVNKNVYVSSESSNEVQSSIVVNKMSHATVIIEQSKASQEENLTLNEELSFKQQCKEIKSMKIPIDKTELTQLSNKQTSIYHTANPSERNKLNEVILKEYKITFTDEKSEKAQSQSNKQIISINDNASDSSHSENSDSSKILRSLSSEFIEKNENILARDLSTQSYEDIKPNETFQSQKNLSNIIINDSTQSLKKMITVNDNKISINKSKDDPNFPNQSCNIEKIENYVEIMEVETDIGQECSSPSHSNGACIDGIGTSASMNSLVLNEDETASSSYVPETPENQERDQDQESAISTSSYEIPPCEELNIASSSLIPDTSIQLEHSSIHNNGVPQIPTSYNLNSDSRSTHVIAVPTSSYEDQIIIEQNISTSFDVPISIGNLEKSDSRNFLTDSSERRNEAINYYPHEEVTESYYESLCKRSSARLETNSEEEAAPRYYERNPTDDTSEASQTFFNHDEVTPNYSNHDISSSYYDTRVDSDVSRSYYSTHDQQGTTTSYTNRYSLEYVPENSPLDRNNLVDNSETTKSIDR
jgi:hypothetical protein